MSSESDDGELKWRKISDWQVIEETTLSDYRSFEFNIQERRSQKNEGRDSKGDRPSSNTRWLSKNKLREHLDA